MPSTPLPSPWLVSRGYDAVIYAGSTLWAAGLVLALANVVEPMRLWVVLHLAFTAAHYGPTWLRAYADREERTARRWSLYVFPPAVLGFTLLTRDRPEVLAFILLVWDRWHAVMQNYGFLRLYDAKAGTSSRRRAVADAALLFTASFLILSLNMGLLAPALSACEAIGLPSLPGAATVRGLQLALAIATAVSAGHWLWLFGRVPQQARTRQLPRLVFAACLVAGHAVMNTTTNVFLLSSHEKIYHSLQYVALVWFYGKRRVERQPAGVTGTAFRAVFAASRWPVYLLATVAWTVLVIAVSRALSSDAAAPGQFTAVIGGVALCHYYFDSFLWRVRRPEVRANV